MRRRARRAQGFLGWVLRAEDSAERPRSKSRAWACGPGAGGGTRPYTSRAIMNAVSAAMAVEEKFTALLPRMPLCSTVAPRKLSAIMPITPAVAQIAVE